MVLKRGVGFVFLACLLVIASCKKKDDSGETEDLFDRKGMLTNLGNAMIVPGYGNLLNQLSILSVAIDAFASQPDSVKLANAREGWRNAVLAWQNVSMFEFGPAEELSLQANLNIYPTNTARIEQNILAGNYDLDEVSNLDAKGFQAVDYLLFGAKDSTIIKFSTDSFAVNRSTYLLELMANMMARVKAVNNKWVPSGGNYLSEFANNSGTDKGSSVSLVVNALSLDFERYFRDGKIGIPAGVRTHTQTPLPEKVEGYYEGVSNLNFALTNFTAFKNLFFGTGENNTTTHIGFDDYLNYLKIQKNGESLTNAITKKFDEIQTALNALNPPLQQEVVVNQSEVINAFNLMQDLVVLLKVDMASSLGVVIVYTDNDGD